MLLESCPAPPGQPHMHSYCLDTLSCQMRDEHQMNCKNERQKRITTENISKGVVGIKSGHMCIFDH